MNERGVIKEDDNNNLGKLREIAMLIAPPHEGRWLAGVCLATFWRSPAGDDVVEFLHNPPSEALYQLFTIADIASREV